MSTGGLQTFFLCVHAHYHQAPRSNPLSTEAFVEPDAAPYETWMARITAECYAPNARLGNFKRLSLDIGEPLAGWLEENDPETYASFLAADAHNLELFSSGNAVAIPFHYTILPLNRLDEKHTQVSWGQKAFETRFDRQSTGMWLPEMAVDLETLEVLAANGIKWTVLTESQVEDKPEGCGPFWVELPSGSRLKVFVRDEYLSNEIAFNLGHFGGAGRWAREVLGSRKRQAGLLTLLAVDGETFGHHWAGEEQFLHWLLKYEANAAGYQMITLERYAKIFEPDATIRIRENTAWSSHYGLARWTTGSPDTEGDSGWKGALRRALDNLAFRLDAIYADETRSLGSEQSAALKDAFIDVILRKVNPATFVGEFGLRLTADAESRLYRLVEAQYWRQYMYTSTGFLVGDLDHPNTRFNIACAGKAIYLTRQASGIDIEPEFRKDLRFAVGVDIVDEQQLTAREIYDELVTPVSERE